ncbi:hypothetical protein V8D89_011218 [Ganoderma adspersum]
MMASVFPMPSHSREYQHHLVHYSRQRVKNPRPLRCDHLAYLIWYPNDLFYTAIDFPQTSLNFNSLLANLNARAESIRATMTDAAQQASPSGPRTQDLGIYFSALQAQMV